MRQTVEAQRAIKEQAIKMVTTLTDEAYRSRLQQQPRLLKGECPAGSDCIADPSKLIYRYATADDLKNAESGNILAVNGILNDERRAVELAYQNIVPDEETRNKPATFYVMHIAPANNTISELLAVAYEKIVASADYGLANFLGYTNGMETYAALLASRGQAATTSLGHSRGTLVQEAAFTILAHRPDENGNLYTNPNLNVRGVGGAANAVSWSEKAMTIQGPGNHKAQVSYNYFSNDPVSVLAGGNPGVWTLKDLWQVFATNNSMHSCYGTGAAGCTQVEIPMPGSPHQGTPEGNAKLIQYERGKRVDNSPIGRNTQEGLQ
jgi:filamentous hemagglutinin